ncbi:MAG: hypothetical protein MJ252_06665 [archaeon]|nr:hypothetical protein [archaeon]
MKEKKSEEKPRSISKNHLSTQKIQKNKLFLNYIIKTEETKKEKSVGKTNIYKFLIKKEHNKKEDSINNKTLLLNKLKKSNEALLKGIQFGHNKNILKINNISKTNSTKEHFLRPSKTFRENTKNTLTIKPRPSSKIIKVIYERGGGPKSSRALILGKQVSTSKYEYTSNRTNSSTNKSLSKGNIASPHKANFFHLYSKTETNENLEATPSNKVKGKTEKTKKVFKKELTLKYITCPTTRELLKKFKSKKVEDNLREIKSYNLKSEIPTEPNIKEHHRVNNKSFSKILLSKCNLNKHFKCNSFFYGKTQSHRQCRLNTFSNQENKQEIKQKIKEMLFNNNIKKECGSPFKLNLDDTIKKRTKILSFSIQNLEDIKKNIKK